MLDTEFDTDGKLVIDIGSSSADYAYGVAIQPDGKLLLAGASDDDFAVLRLNADGTPDSGFGTSGEFVHDFNLGGDDLDAAYDLAIQNDGTIVVSGSAQRTRPIIGTYYEFALLRLTAAGAFDTSFDGDGGKFTDFGAGTETGLTVGIQRDGRILLGGSIGANHFAMIRVTTAGALDSTFDGDGKVTTDFASATDTLRGLAILPGLKLLNVI